MCVCCVEYNAVVSIVSQLGCEVILMPLFFLYIAKAGVVQLVYTSERVIRLCEEGYIYVCVCVSVYEAIWALRAYRVYMYG